MGDKRRLQAEIDRTLKKVSEGVEAFEETWKKMQHAPNANQKDKYEAELKREIKKLQRLRDHIKNWIASNDIKDKKALFDNRKLIEQKMELFKVVERETKTKAYSKEGLQGAGQKVDPAEKEKEDCACWLSEKISQLKSMIELTEGALEALPPAKRKKGKEDKEREKKIAELNDCLDKHKFHAEKLEAVMRVLDNEGIDAKDVMGELTDSVEYYVDHHMDDDFMFDDSIYNELKLEEISEMILAPSAPVVATSPPKENAEDSPMTLSTTPKNSTSEQPVVPPSTLSGSVSPGVKNESEPDKRLTKKASSEERNNKKTYLFSKIHQQSQDSHSNLISTQVSSEGPSNATNSHPMDYQASVLSNLAQPVQLQSFSHEESQGPVRSLMSEIVGGDMGFQGTNRPTQRPRGYLDVLHSRPEAQPQPPNLMDVNLPKPDLGFRQPRAEEPTPRILARGTVLDKGTVGNTGNPGLEAGTEFIHTTGSVETPRPTSTSSSHASDHETRVNTLQNLAQQALPQQAISELRSEPVLEEIQPVSRATVTPFPQRPMYTDLIGERSAFVPNSGQLSSVGLSTIPSSFSTSTAGLQSALAPSVSLVSGNQSRECILTTSQGAAPLDKIPLNDVLKARRERFDLAIKAMPIPGDGDRVRILPRQTVGRTKPPHYPILPPAEFSNPKAYENMSAEVLFFAFYYMEGSEAQHFAARALNKLSWRYHTQEKTWFQRQEPPTELTDTFEEGNFVCWDPRSWTRCQRRFTFHYKFLEERDFS